MTTRRVTGPAIEPLTIDELKLLLRIDGSDEDSQLAMHLAAARREAEHKTAATLIETQWELLLDGFPATGEGIRLHYGPVMSIDAVQYVDEAGVTQTWAAANYALAPALGADYLVPAYGGDWPQTQDLANAVRIVYTAGHGGATDSARRAAVPTPVRSWIALRAKYLRDNSIALQGNAPVWPGFLDGQLDELRQVHV